MASLPQPAAAIQSLPQELLGTDSSRGPPRLWRGDRPLLLPFDHAGLVVVLSAASGGSKSQDFR